MLSPRFAFVALWLANALASVQAATGGSFESGGNTQISALMVSLTFMRWCAWAILNVTDSYVSTADVPG